MVISIAHAIKLGNASSEIVQIFVPSREQLELEIASAVASIPQVSRPSVNTRRRQAACSLRELAISI